MEVKIKELTNKRLNSESASTSKPSRVDTIVSKRENSRNPAASNPDTTMALVRQKRLEPIESLFGETLLKSNGDTVNTRILAKEEGVLGVYFSANWCPPCRTFTPVLLMLYEEMKKAENYFEVIFVSFDIQEDMYKTYFSKMPWLAVQFDPEEKREDIAQKYNIGGIPQLLLLDPQNLEIISKHGREIVMADPKGDLYPWRDIPDPASLQAKLLGSLREELEKAAKLVQNHEQFKEKTEVKQSQEQSSVKTEVKQNQEQSNEKTEVTLDDSQITEQVPEENDETEHQTQSAEGS